MPERDVINEGFMVDLKYNPLAKPLKIYQIVDGLQQILSKQTRYKPLNKNGHGNQGYIFPLIDEAGEYLLKKTGFES